MTSTKAHKANQRNAIKTKQREQTYHKCPKCPREWDSAAKARACCKQIGPRRV